MWLARLVLWGLWSGWLRVLDAESQSRSEFEEGTSDELSAAEDCRISCYMDNLVSKSAQPTNDRPNQREVPSPRKPSATLRLCVKKSTPNPTNERQNQREVPYRFQEIPSAPKRTRPGVGIASGTALASSR